MRINTGEGNVGRVEDLTGQPNHDRWRECKNIKQRIAQGKPGFIQKQKLVCKRMSHSFGVLPLYTHGHSRNNRKKV